MKSEVINMTRAWNKENIRAREHQNIIYHTHSDFDSADPSSMQDTCHTRTRLYDIALHEFS